MSIKRILLIIPAFNEGQNILSTVNMVRHYHSTQDYSMDYIVINDGSTDNTEEICLKHGINHISLIQNLGIGGAVQCGYCYAKEKNYDIAVQFDGDGQHDINSLDALLKPILYGSADFVIGSRFINDTCEFKSTAVRRVGIWYLSEMIYRFSGQRITDPTSGFRAASKKTISFFASSYAIDYPEPESIVALIKNGFRVQEVPANMFCRMAGKSSITFFRAVYYMIKVSIAVVCAGQKKRKGGANVECLEN